MPKRDNSLRYIIKQEGFFRLKTMAQIIPENIWSMNEEELLRLVESGFFKPISREIRFYVPSFSHYKTKNYFSSPTSFPTITVTGTSCTLNCRHCGGKVLETMHPALSPKKLFGLCSRMKQDGARGCLVSGGCLADGSVPLEGFIRILGKINQELGLTVFVHTGIINLETAVGLKKAGVDAALIDIIGSAETIKKTFDSKITVQDYVASLEALNNAGLNFVPHIVVGLNDGKLDGEFEALKMTRKVKPSALVIIAFMPIRGTIMAKTPPPKPIEIAKVLSIARLMFPEIPLILGCMRPKDASRGQIDILALKSGVDAVAFPSEEVVKYAHEEGYITSFSPYCCAQVYIDAAKKKKC
jgi:uncharacterized radical SAM superfamily protein